MKGANRGLVEEEAGLGGVVVGEYDERVGGASGRPPSPRRSRSFSRSASRGGRSAGRSEPRRRGRGPALSEPVAPRKRCPLSVSRALAAPSAPSVVIVGGKVPQLGSSSSATSSSPMLRNRSASHSAASRSPGEQGGRCIAASVKTTSRSVSSDGRGAGLFLCRGLGQGPRRLSGGSAATGASPAPISVCAFESRPRIRTNVAITPEQGDSRPDHERVRVALGQRGGPDVALRGEVVDRRERDRREDREAERAADLLGGVDQPAARPASRSTTPLIAAIVTGTNEKPRPTAASSDGNRMSPR